MQNENQFILKTLCVSVVTDHPSWTEIRKKKSPFSVSASISEMVWCQSITWIRAACLWWTPTFQTYDGKNPVGLRKGGRKCGLLKMNEDVEEEWMITLSCFNLCYSPSFRHSIPHHPFVFLFMSPCLVLFLSFCSTSSSLPYVPSPTPHLSKTAGGTLRSAKWPRLHNHWWNGWQWVHCSAGHLSSW